MPAQKKRLEASDEVRMMARTRGSVERVSKAVIRDVAIVSVKEFLAWGRWREMMIIGVTVGEVEGWWERVMAGRAREA
jgi:hypothetical protein